MYTFTKFETPKRGRQTASRISVVDFEDKKGNARKKILLWEGYKKLHSDALYANIFYDESQSAIGLKLSPAKEESAYFLQAGRQINSNLFTFPAGLYDYKETTLEGVDVFIKKT